MSHRLVVALVSALTCTAAADASSQAAVSPVAPQPPTVAAYERTLTGLLKEGSNDRLWNGTTATEKAALLQNVDKLASDITIQMPVGPVAPRPPVKPPSSSPQPTRPPQIRPTKADFDKSLEGLRKLLQQTTWAYPRQGLPATSTSR